jgi:hypothetical protein
MLISLLLFLSSCEDGANTPDASLSNYLKIRTSSDVDLEFYQKYTGGKLLSAIEALSEEEFSEAGKKIDVKKKNFKILKKNCNNDEVCFLTYILEYDSPSEKPETISEVKKIAELHKIENQWRIVDVTNVKTYHENKEPLVINIGENPEDSEELVVEEE